MENELLSFSSFTKKSTIVNRMKDVCIDREKESEKDQIKQVQKKNSDAEDSIKTKK